MASPLPPIASPVARRWREIRIQILPGIAFACIAAAVSALWNECVTPHRPAAPAGTNLVTAASTPSPVRPAVMNGGRNMTD